MKHSDDIFFESKEKQSKKGGFVLKFGSTMQMIVFNNTCCHYPRF